MSQVPRLTMREALDLILAINEAMYPGGDPEAEHSADTTMEVAVLLKRAGIMPETTGLEVRHR